MKTLFSAAFSAGVLILILGIVSRPIRRSLWISEPLIALGLGVLLGPKLLNVFHAGQVKGGELLLEEACQWALGLALMAIALRLPTRYAPRHWGALTLLLVVAMPLGWLVAAGLLHAFVGLEWPLAFLAAAIITPTDPVVASAIVTGHEAHARLPGRLRHLVSCEAGFNDGLGVLMVLLGIVWWHHDPMHAIKETLSRGLLKEILGGAALGAALGYAAGRLLCWSERRGFIDAGAFRVHSLALALLVMGASRLLAVAPLLAVFVSGLLFDAAIQSRERWEQTQVQEALSQFFTLPIFALLGVLLPVDAWVKLGWTAIATAVVVLILRRLPIVLALYRAVTPLKTWRDAGFVGWFGPVGLSAVLYGMYALRHGAPRHVWEVCSLVITCSIVLHGVTSTPLTKAYGRHGG